MKLPRLGRENYGFKATTVPDVGPWEASFDGGQTWHPATVVDGWNKWMVNGPDFVADDDITSITVTTTMRPKIRVVDQQEVILRPPPTIYVV